MVPGYRFWKGLWLYSVSCTSLTTTPAILKWPSTILTRTHINQCKSRLFIHCYQNTKGHLQSSNRPSSSRPCAGLSCNGVKTGRIFMRVSTCTKFVPLWSKPLCRKEFSFQSAPCSLGSLGSRGSLGRWPSLLLFSTWGLSDMLSCPPATTISASPVLDSTVFPGCQPHNWTLTRTKKMMEINIELRSLTSSQPMQNPKLYVEVSLAQHGTLESRARVFFWLAPVTLLNSGATVLACCWSVRDSNISKQAMMVMMIIYQ